MKRIRYIIPILIALIFFGCDKDDDLVGDWFYDINCEISVGDKTYNKLKWCYGSISGFHQNGNSSNHCLYLLNDDEDRVIIRKGESNYLRVNSIHLYKQNEFNGGEKFDVSSIGIGESKSEYYLSVTRLNETDFEIYIDRESEYFSERNIMVVVMDISIDDKARYGGKPPKDGKYDIEYASFDIYFSK